MSRSSVWVGQFVHLSAPLPLLHSPSFHSSLSIVGQFETLSFSVRFSLFSSVLIFTLSVFLSVLTRSNPSCKADSPPTPLAHTGVELILCHGLLSTSSMGGLGEMCLMHLPMRYELCHLGPDKCWLEHWLAAFCLWGAYSSIMSNSWLPVAFVGELIACAICFKYGNLMCLEFRKNCSGLFWTRSANGSTCVLVWTLPDERGVRCLALDSWRCDRSIEKCCTPCWSSSRVCSAVSYIVPLGCALLPSPAGLLTQKSLLCKVGLSRTSKCSVAVTTSKQLSSQCRVK